MSEVQGSLRLLVVDDSEADYVKIARLLRTDGDPGPDIVHAETGSEALDLCRARPPDCVLLDYRLPDMDGLEFLTTMSESSDSAPVPVIMLTGMGSESLAVDAMKYGAQDYLNKNTMTYGQVTRAIQGAIEVVGLKRELDATKDTLERMAFYDSLTGIGNRNLFADRMNHSLMLARRSSSALAVMVIDLNEFKAVNDTFGHAAGDAVLCAVGKRLLDVLRQSDTATRLGGDEFAIILETDVSTEGVTRVADKIIDALEAPVEHGDEHLRIGASIGIAMFPEHADSGERLVHCADTAMYRAKRDDGGYAIYSPELAAGEHPERLAAAC